MASKDEMIKIACKTCREAFKNELEYNANFSWKDECKLVRDVSFGMYRKKAGISLKKKQRILQKQVEKKKARESL